MVVVVLVNHNSAHDSTTQLRGGELYKYQENKEEQKSEVPC